MAAGDEPVGALPAAPPDARRLRRRPPRRRRRTRPRRGAARATMATDASDEPEDPEPDAGPVDVVDDRVAAPEPLAARGASGSARRRRAAPLAPPAGSRARPVGGGPAPGGSAISAAPPDTGGSTATSSRVAHRLVGLARLAVAPDGAVLEEVAERGAVAGAGGVEHGRPRWRPAARRARCRPPRGPRRTVAARPTVTSSESANARRERSDEPFATDPTGRAATRGRSG